MAYDKVVDSAALEAALKASADAIRGKTGGSGSIPWDAVKGFADAIAAIETGGGSGGGGFNSDHADIAYGSFVVAEGKSRVLVECGFPISKDDAFMCVFGGVPIAERTESANIAGYIANNMPSAALGTVYGGAFYANKTATSLSAFTSQSISNWFLKTTGTNISINGYGAWQFVPSLEYFWVVVKEKNV